MTHNKVREMTEEDLAKVLEWRNHSDVRHYMYSKNRISLAEHRKWFADTKKDPAITLLIYEQETEALGFLNITRTSFFDVADWGFYIAPNAPKGCGRGLGEKALQYAFIDMDLRKVCGQVIGFNERSILFHKALGFTEEGRLREQYSDGNQFHDVLCFGLLQYEWKAKD